MLFALALMPTMAVAQEFSDIKTSKGSINLKSQGSFFIGGNTHQIDATYAGTSPGGSMINQMYVQYQIPAHANKLPPIVFVHGCCLSSKTWETTPDGRMGWFEYFTRKGYKTYMADQVGRARSGFDALQYQKVRFDAGCASVHR
jgi:pimeloyl-ACP methyl ester carboxylesterase